MLNEMRFNTVSGLHKDTIIRLKGDGVGNVKFVKISDLHDNLESYLKQGYMVQSYNYDTLVFTDTGIVDVTRTAEPVEMKKLSISTDDYKAEFVMTPDTFVRVYDTVIDTLKVEDNPYKAIILAQLNRTIKAGDNRYLLAVHKNRTDMTIESKNITITTYPTLEYGYDLYLDAYEQCWYQIGNFKGMFILA